MFFGHELPQNHFRDYTTVKYLIFLLACTPCLAQLEGVVRNSDTQEPIAGARVRIQRAEAFTLTDASGQFVLNDTATMPFNVTAAAYHFYNGFVEVTGTRGGGLVIELDPISIEPGKNNWDPTEPLECEGCHPNQYAQWLGSPMQMTGNNTWVFDVYDGTGTASGSNGFVYQRDSMHYPGNFNSDCSACHSPVHWLKTFEIEPPVKTMGDSSNPNMDMMNGVQCEVCHRAFDVDINQTYNPGVQPESFKLLKYNGNDTPLEFGLLGDVTYHNGVMRAAYNPILSAQLCSGCHEDTVDHDDDGDFSPEDGSLPHESTFTEWQAFQGLGNDQTCIDCHMPLTEDTAFCSLVLEERRPNTIRNHLIRGTSPPFLENALSLDVAEIVDFGQYRLDITVTNDLTGHAVPTGVMLRNVILLVLARDGEGILLPLAAGDLVDDVGGVGIGDGDYAGLPGQAFYRNMSNGVDDLVFYTEALSIPSDTRIQPGQSYAGSFVFDLGHDGPRNIDTEIKLIYRRSYRETTLAKGWTQTGHGEVLADIQPPHYGHLMEFEALAADICSDKDLDGSLVVDLDDLDLLNPQWLDPAPFLSQQQATTSVRHFIALVNCLSAE